MKKHILSLPLFLLLSSVSAQGYDIEGILLGSTISEKLIEEKLGSDYSVQNYHTYTQISIINENDESAKFALIGYPVEETAYIFGNDTLFLDCKNRLFRVVLNTDRFSVNTKNNRKGFHVGAGFCGNNLNRLCAAKWTEEYSSDGEQLESMKCHNKSMMLTVSAGLVSRISLYSISGDDIAGIGIGEKVSRRDVIKMLGTPQKIVSCDYYGTGVPVEVYTYIDGGEESILIFSGDGRLLQYRISSPVFKTFTETVPGGLSVGDSVERVAPIFKDSGGGKIRDVDSNYPFVVVSDGIIRIVGYYIND